MRNEINDNNKKGDGNSKTYGVKCLPLWNIDPSRYIVPILHLEIGLVNKVWASFIAYLSENVDMMTEEERKARMEYHAIKRGLIILNDRYKQLVNNLGDIIYEIKELENWNTVNKNDRVIDEQKRIQFADNKQKLVVLKEEKRTVKTNIKETKISIKTQDKKSTEIKGDIKKYISRREGNEDGLDTKLEKLLEQQCKIYVQSFHGGEMNGVCCRRLLDNIDTVIENVYSIVLETFDKIDEAKKLTTQQDVKNHIDDVASMLRMTDYIFR